jgi:tRNA threonylcarbamoyladenosine biosynthesis protein TsaE
MKKSVASEQAMRSFGAAMGALLRGDETIELVGDVGAGKTTFVKGLALGLGIDEEVQSPSFTISRVYDARDGMTLAHYDFYRLGEAGILSEDVHEAIEDDHTVTVIEWAGIVETVLPSARIRIVFTTISETERALDITATVTLEEELV